MIWIDWAARKLCRCEPISGRRIPPPVAVGLMVKFASQGCVLETANDSHESFFKTKTISESIRYYYFNSANYQRFFWGDFSIAIGN
jgi:hypothetical protein